MGFPIWKDLERGKHGKELVRLLQEVVEATLDKIGKPLSLVLRSAYVEPAQGDWFDFVITADCRTGLHGSNRKNLSASIQVSGQQVLATRTPHHTLRYAAEECAKKLIDEACVSELGSTYSDLYSKHMAERAARITNQLPIKIIADPRVGEDEVILTDDKSTLVVSNVGKPENKELKAAIKRRKKDSFWG